MSDRVVASGEGMTTDDHRTRFNSLVYTLEEPERTRALSWIALSERR